MADKKLKMIIWSVLLICSLVGDGYSQESDFSFRQGETLEGFGKRIIPMGMRLAHTVVRGDFGPTKDNIVILFHENDGAHYIGWILAPDGVVYKRFVLSEASFPIYTNVEAVFFANIDSDADRELLILCKHISGIGRPPGNTTPFWNLYIYDWDGAKYKHRDDDLPSEFDEFSVQSEYRTVTSIRKRLKELGY